MKMNRRCKISNFNRVPALKDSHQMKLSREMCAERSNLISTLFLEASSSPSKVTTSALWENHQRIREILEKLTPIECVLNVELPHRTQQSITNLESWALSNGVEMNNVNIVKFEDIGYGLQATTNILEGTIVISVPKSLMITVDSIKHSAMETLYNEDVVLQQLPNVALAIFILMEKFRADKPSFWLPYLMALPSTYTTCLYFSLDDLKELKGSPALEYSLKMYKNIARQYAYFWNIFQKNSDETSKILRDVFTFEQYRWAVSTVMTRQNYIPCSDQSPVNAIIPVWDFCNHTNTEDKYNAEPSTTYDVEDERCVFLAPKNFFKGEQINIFYGKRSNADFLVHNGFVYPENHHDVVKVRFGIPNTDCYYPLRSALLKKLGLPTSGEYAIKKDEQNPIDLSALAFVRIFKMNEDELQKWVNCENPEKVLFGPIACMGAKFDIIVLQYILTRICILLKTYPTTLEQDEEMLKQCSLAKIRRLIVLHRLIEKKILLNAVAYCEMKLNELNLRQLSSQNENNAL